MGRARHSRHGIKLPACACLVLGACAGIFGLFMPWIAIDAGILSLLGIVPDDPVDGYRIPALVSEAGGHPLLQGGAALSELLSGRLDLAAARLLFGERYEEEWAPIVLLPAVWCIVALLLLRFHRFALLRKLIAVMGVFIFVGTLAVAFRLSGEAAASSLLQPTLQVFDGLWVTVGGSGLSAAGAVLLVWDKRRR